MADPTTSPSASATSASAVGRGPNRASASISGVPVTASGSRSYTASSTMNSNSRGTSSGVAARTRTTPGAAPSGVPRPGAAAPAGSGGGLIAGSRLLGTRDLALEDLARGALGQVVHQPDHPRVLVGRHLALDVVAQLLGRGRRALLERDGGADLLAVLVVGDAHDRGLPDRRVLVEHLLDLARVDVVAAADDQLLLAVHDVEVAVLIDAAHVAGVQPAVDDRLGRRLRPLPVALHHVVAADDDLAHLALGHLVAVVVDHPHLHVLDRGADRAG